MKLRLRLGQPKDRLRSHLQSSLDDSLGRLPSHDRTQLLDDLCFLLRGPLFLYAIAPRIRRATASSQRDTTGLMTPSWLADECVKEEGIDISALNMKIGWDGESWVTQLLYDNISLIEGREYNTKKKAGYAPSFHWFCEEARFLSCEFHAREQLAMVAPSDAVDAEPREVEDHQTRAKSAGKKERRVVKLSIRYKMVRGKPKLTKKAS
ncbi:hypothetical protein J4E83_007144 [Alternaria metachromatica]|uniref:uncharacterized protein n=1 Tax=Alternaria metachromatica TaxID=283354 RepID=UPI0020C2B61D|nr:uncharacterized protein J4E83_007144 [Alternaria metachromatica]KAI4614490.1 hypothetical protein J4E83_007144 [Alternaria metachromatica]